MIVPELDYPEGKGPETYWMLVQALQNLLDDDPKSNELFDRRQEANKEGETSPIRINQSNIAIESGKLGRRKLILGEDPTYPKLAAFVAGLRATHGVSVNTSERLKRQSEDIAVLTQKVRVLRSRMFEEINKRSKAEGELLDAQEQIVRLKRGRTD